MTTAPQLFDICVDAGELGFWWPVHCDSLWVSKTGIWAVRIEAGTNYSYWYNESQVPLVSFIILCARYFKLTCPQPGINRSTRLKTINKPYSQTYPFEDAAPTGIATSISIISSKLFQASSSVAKEAVSPYFVPSPFTTVAFHNLPSLSSCFLHSIA